MERGGALETVVDWQTGVFFKERSVASLVDAIERSDSMTFNPVVIRTNAERFSASVFRTRFRDPIAAIEALTGSKPVVEFKPSRPFDVQTNVLDISRARAELDWHPRISLTDGLRRTLYWLLTSQESR